MIKENILYTIYYINKSHSFGRSNRARLPYDNSNQGEFLHE